jgi:hypothetical protein
LREDGRDRPPGDRPPYAAVTGQGLPGRDDDALAYVHDQSKMM